MKKLLLLWGVVILMSCQNDKVIDGQDIENDMIFFRLNADGKCYAGYLEKRLFRKPTLKFVIPVSCENIKDLASKTVYPL